MWSKAAPVDKLLYAAASKPTHPGGGSEKPVSSNGGGGEAPKSGALVYRQQVKLPQKRTRTTSAPACQPLGGENLLEMLQRIKPTSLPSRKDVGRISLELRSRQPQQLEEVPTERFGALLRSLQPLLQAALVDQGGVQVAPCTVF
jgi:hypothetical protein